MREIGIEDVRLALDDALRADSMEVRVDLSPRGSASPAVRLPVPTVAEATDAIEEAEYRAFAASLGIEDDEPPVRMVTVSVEQLVEWKAQRALLNDLMRQRPENISDAEEAEYQAFLSLIGPV